MNDTPAQPAEPKNNTSRTILLFILAILLVVAIGFFASKVGLDKALVRQQVDAFANRLAERGKMEGRDLRFSYGDIEVTTGFTDKHAVLHDVQVVVRPLEPPKDEDKPSSLLITTPRLELYPESSDLSALRLMFPEPINVATVEEPEASLLKIASSVPAVLLVQQETKDNVQYSSMRFKVPPEIVLTYLREHKGEGAEETTPNVVPVYENLRVTMTNGTGDLTIEQGEGALGEGSLELEDIALIPEVQPEGAIKIKSISSKWSNVLNENNVNVVNSSVILGEVTAPAEVIPYAPLSMALDFTFEGPMPNSPEEIASIRAQESSFKLRTFAIKTKDAEVNATADFIASAEDVLPVGMANLTITNLPFIMSELKKNEMLDNAGTQLVSAILQQVTGVPYAELKDVTIDIQRSRGGAFMIGKSTFEELFAILLTGKLSPGAIMPSAPPPGAEPKKDTPAEKPIPAPVDDARG